MSTQRAPRELRHTKIWHSLPDHRDISRRKDDALYLAFPNHATSFSNRYSQDRNEDKGEGPSTQRMKTRIKRKPPPVADEDYVDHVEKHILEVVGECTRAGVQSGSNQTSTSVKSKGHLTSGPLTLEEAPAAIDHKGKQMSTENGRRTDTTRRLSRQSRSENQTIIAGKYNESPKPGKRLAEHLTPPRPLSINKKAGLQGRPTSPTKLPVSPQNNTGKASSSYSVAAPPCTTSAKPSHTAHRPTIPRRNGIYNVPRAPEVMATMDTKTQMTQDIKPLQPRRSPMRRTTTHRSDVFCSEKSTSVITDKTRIHNDGHTPAHFGHNAEELLFPEKHPQPRRPPFQRTFSFRGGSRERLPLGDISTTEDVSVAPVLQSLSVRKPSGRLSPSPSESDGIVSATRTTSRADRSSAAEIPLRGRPPLRREPTIRPSADLGMARTDDFGHREASTAELENFLEKSMCESETDSAFEFPLRPGMVSVLMEAEKSFWHEESGEPENADQPPRKLILDDLFDIPLAPDPEEVEMIARSAPIVTLYQERRKYARFMPKVPSPMNPIRDGTHGDAWTSVLGGKEGKCLKHRLSKYGFWYLSDYLRLLRSKLF